MAKATVKMLNKRLEMLLKANEQLLRERAPLQEENKKLREEVNGRALVVESAVHSRLDLHRKLDAANARGNYFEMQAKKWVRLLTVRGFLRSLHDKAYAVVRAYRVAGRGGELATEKKLRELSVEHGVSARDLRDVLSEFSRDDEVSVSIDDPNWQPPMFPKPPEETWKVTSEEAKPGTYETEVKSASYPDGSSVAITLASKE